MRYARSRESAQQRYLTRLVGQMEQADEWELAQQVRDARAELPDGPERLPALQELVQRATESLGSAGGRPRRVDWLPRRRKG